MWFMNFYGERNMTNYDVIVVLWYILWNVKMLVALAVGHCNTSHTHTCFFLPSSKAIQNKNEWDALTYYFDLRLTQHDFLIFGPPFILSSLNLLLEKMRIFRAYPGYRICATAWADVNQIHYYLHDFLAKKINLHLSIFFTS